MPTVAEDASGCPDGSSRPCWIDTSSTRHEISIGISSVPGDHLLSSNRLHVIGDRVDAVVSHASPLGQQRVAGVAKPPDPIVQFASRLVVPAGTVPSQPDRPRNDAPCENDRYKLIRRAPVVVTSARSR